MSYSPYDGQTKAFEVSTLTMTSQMQLISHGDVIPVDGATIKSVE